MEWPPQRGIDTRRQSSAEACDRLRRNLDPEAESRQYFGATIPITRRAQIYNKLKMIARPRAWASKFDAAVDLSPRDHPARILWLFALRPFFGPPDVGVFRLRYDGGLAAPSRLSKVIGGLCPIAPCGTLRCSIFANPPILFGQPWLQRRRETGERIDYREHAQLAFRSQLVV
jgi:hypothetical protein